MTQTNADPRHLRESAEMQLVTTIPPLREAIRKAKDRGLKVGLVPTMGALHAGHISLIRAARQETDFVVASIFVNPAQFWPEEDFTRYPRPFESDTAACREQGVDLLFAPAVETVYPEGFETLVELGTLQGGLEGRFRPGHFRGVCTVVLKLFNMVQPDVAYFGQKDAQQARIILQLVRDLDLPIELRVCPIVREPDGLALSSRNQYLTPEQRRHASVLFRALQAAESMTMEGGRDARKIQQRMTAMIGDARGAVIDYVELVDNDSLQPVKRIDRPVLAAVAVRFGKTRLIDNTTLKNL